MVRRRKDSYYEALVTAAAVDTSEVLVLSYTSYVE